MSSRVSSIKNQENTKRNALIAGSVAGIAGAIGGYRTYSPFKGNELKDSFVKACDINSTKSICKYHKNIARNIIKTIKDEFAFAKKAPSLKKAKEYLEGYLGNVSGMNKDKIIDLASKIAKANVSEEKNYISEFFENGKLKNIEDLNIYEKEFYTPIYSALKTSKIKSAAAAGGILAFAAGSTLFLLTNKNSEK